ncbi:850_t:CDS:2 [Funneliformis caledonium]|uniref:850_t:CDS:1 n=1 Tax=Funneliformis caledonium TaxID=1117310 RepID=A0A9N8W4E4_9GLOM|nr:850_t:CDS:2 [Funneliformis caledonium]
MSFTSSSSGWKSATVRKVKKVRNKVDNIVHNYPKLPDFPLGEENLPFQIGKNVSVKEYNTFVDRHESTGYKFYWENKNVYIIEMANADHEAVVSTLMQFFLLPNNGVIILPPIRVLPQPFHFNPAGQGEKTAPDVAVYPASAHVPRPGIPHPGPPPSDTNGNPHARIIVETANWQSLEYLNEKCGAWMRQQYVRDVLGIKLDAIRSHQGQVHRSMLATLWTRQNVSPTAPVGYVAPPGFTVSTDPNLPRVSFRTWDFGTLLYGTTNANACTAPNLPAYQVTIPIEDVFWNPPIVPNTTTRTNILNETGYIITVPNVITVPNFIIDLFAVQQAVLDTQRL